MKNNKIKMMIFYGTVAFIAAIACSVNFINVSGGLAPPGGENPPDSPLEVGEDYWIDFRIKYQEKDGWWIFKRWKTRTSVRFQIRAKCLEAPYGGKYLDIVIGIQGALYTFAYIHECSGHPVTNIQGKYYISGNDGGLKDTVVQISGSPTFTVDGHTFNPEVMLQMDIMGGHNVDYDIGSIPSGWRADVDYWTEGDFCLTELILKKLPYIVTKLF
jgi:hypothetical protein